MALSSVLNSDRIAALMELDDDGSDFFADLVEMYLEEFEVARAAIRTALDTGDQKVVGSTAHRIKGSSGNIGADRMAELCSDLEAAAMASEMTNGRELFSRIENHMPELLAALGKYRSR